MPVLSNAASLKVGAQQAAKVMLGGAMVWEFYTPEWPSDAPLSDEISGITVTPNATATAYPEYKLYRPKGPQL